MWKQTIRNAIFLICQFVRAFSADWIWLYILLKIKIKVIQGCGGFASPKLQRWFWIGGRGHNFYEPWNYLPKWHVIVIKCTLSIGSAWMIVSGGWGCMVQLVHICLLLELAGFECRRRLIEFWIFEFCCVIYGCGHMIGSFNNLNHYVSTYNSRYKAGLVYNSRPTWTVKLCLHNSILLLFLCLKYVWNI